MFKCELCDKEVKHTRNIIGAHMKMVHLISWKEYQVSYQYTRKAPTDNLGHPESKKNLYQVLLKLRYRNCEFQPYK